MLQLALPPAPHGAHLSGASSATLKNMEQSNEGVA